MKKFKGLYAPDQFFTFKGEMYECVNWFFETADIDMITFLLGNSNFVLVEEVVETKKK